MKIDRKSMKIDGNRGEIWWFCSRLDRDLALLKAFKAMLAAVRAWRPVVQGAKRFSGGIRILEEAHKARESRLLGGVSMPFSLFLSLFG